jgi:hypothetical protein
MPEVKPPAVKKLTQKQKILALMCRQPNKWFYPYEFMKPQLGALYVGYKAPTRITELNKSYPYLFEEKRDDKYKQRRINVAAMPQWYESLSADLKDTVDQFYQVGDLPA